MRSDRESEAPMQRKPSNSLLCPNCRKLISADEAACPHCGLARPGARWKRGQWLYAFKDTDTLLRLIIGINVIFYLLAIAFNPRGAFLTLNPLTFLAPAGRTLLLLGATGRLPIDGLLLRPIAGWPVVDQLLRWSTLLTANYLHGSLLHILFNMLVLRHIGLLAGREFGAGRMFVIYTLSGICGFAVSYLAGVAFTIGASAAVCGLIGAMIYYGKSRGGVYGNLIYRQIGGWAIGLLLIGLLPGINNWGHGGGFVAGLGLAWLLGYQEQRRESFQHRALAGVCALATTLSLGGSLLYAAFALLQG